MMPLILYLFLKLYHGIQWWRIDDRNTLAKYYVSSCTYYISFDIEMTLVLLTTQATLNPGAKGLGWTMVCLTPILLYLLHLYMSLVDQNQFRYNKLRDYFKKKAADAAAQLEKDKMAVERDR